MKWSSIKSIIIYFLLGVNIFLLVFMAVSTYRQNIVPEEIINSSFNVLKKSGFKVDKQLLPEKNSNLPQLNAEFYSASELSEMFFDKKLAFRTKGESLIAADKKGTLTVSSNYFCFEKNTADFKEATEDELLKSLNNIGFNMENSIYDEKNGYFYQNYKNINLFNMYMEVKLDKKGEISYISAQWPKSISSGKKQSVSFYSHITKIKKAFEKGGEISNIEFGYSLARSHNDTFVFNPAWRVTVGKESTIIE